MPRPFLIPALLTALLTTILAAACLPAAAEPAVAHDRPGKKHILLLNSYDRNFVWNKQIYQGVADVFRPAETGAVIHIHDMDAKRTAHTVQSAARLRDALVRTYADVPLDLILVTDNDAFDFMRAHHQRLFPGVPVVFCGVNSFQPEQIADHPLFTGVAERIDVRRTMELALAIHPDTRSVYFVVDQTTSGLALSETIRQDMAALDPSVEVRLSGSQTLDEILADIDGLPGDALVYYGLYYRDPEGKYYEMSEGVSAVALRSQVPVYGSVELDLGHGIVGGMLVNGLSQGRAMAQLGLHVLAGQAPKDLPVISEGVSRPMFDWRRLDRFSIPLALLPDESEIINRPGSFYSENKPFIVLGAAFAAVQTLIILALAVNTSRRKQAERSLRRAHQLLEERVRERTSEVKETVQALRAVFDAAQDAIFIHTVGGDIVDANDRMLDIYGVRREELGDLSISRDLSSRDNAVYRLSAIWRAVLNGQPQRFEWKARRPKDGREFDVEVNLNRIVFRGEEAILTNVRDISVRKEAENRIRQSLSRFEAILENSLMGIAMSRRRTLAIINRRGAEIFDYAPGELIGEEISRLLDSPEAMETFVAASRDALTRTGEFNTEQAFRAKDGREVWCRMYAKAVDPDSLDRGVIWAWDDVTDRRRVQEEIERAREDAESANRAKSEFLAAMSHEIRTPMNAIVGMTDIALQTDLTEDQREYLRIVKDSSQHLLSIINDILDLSKIEARKLTLDRIDFDLRHHVRSTVKGLEVQARQKGLDLTLTVDDDAPISLKGDPLSLRQVLVNLVGNAVKFTRRGSVSVRVSPLAPDSKRDPDDPRTLGVAVDVADTGIGIPEDFIDSIFQSFAQSTRAFGGTGLGLAICKELIGLMGGDISVESRPGAGSVFTFTAWFEPGLACAAPAPALSSQPSQILSRPVHVLVAEDNEVNVMVTAMRLEERGFTYAVASTGLEVLDMLKRDRFDIILMDIEMPVLDGISATKAIRSAPRDGPIADPDIPIVGVTAHALKEFRDRSLAAGMNAYVSKPVDFQELSGVINRLLGAPPSPAPSATDDAAPWTPDAARAGLDVDDAVFAGFLDAAGAELRLLGPELNQALADGDSEAATELARTAAAVCRTLAADEAARLARELAADCARGACGLDDLAALEHALQNVLSRLDG